MLHISIEEDLEMNDEQWFQYTDPLRMYRSVRPLSSLRLRRLLSCAACRQVWHLLHDERSRQAVVTMERYADGTVPRRCLRAAKQAAEEAAQELCLDTAAAAHVSAAYAVATAATDSRWTCTIQALEACQRAAAAEAEERGLRPEAGLAAAQEVQCELVRDIFGGYRQPLGRRQFPAHVVGLAEACYDAFPEATPDFLILADALDDLGEHRAAAHCRRPLHVRGCHVIDWIIGQAQTPRLQSMTKAWRH
jgi:hypothetical protein